LKDKWKRPFNLLFAGDDAIHVSSASLEEHLAVVEGQLDNVIRTASSLTVERQGDDWAVAKDLQKEIRSSSAANAA
jgi:hypothetical protein